MNRKLPLLALLLVAASAYAADSQVYKWTDAGGVIHYSDAPPPKDTQNVQTVRVSGGDRPRAVASDNGEAADATDKPKDTAAANPPAQDAAATPPATATSPSTTKRWTRREDRTTPPKPPRSG